MDLQAVNMALQKKLNFSRLLGKFFDWRIKRLDAESEQLLERIEAATTHAASQPPKDGWLRATPDSPGACCFGDGWHRVEDWGVWGMGDRHELLLWLPHDVGPRPIELQMDVMVMLTEDSKPEVVCVVADRVVHQRSFAGSEETVVFAIPAGSSNAEFVSVVFNFPRPICPAKLGISTDMRELGLGVKRFRYKYIDSQV